MLPVRLWIARVLLCCLWCCVTAPVVQAQEEGTQNERAVQSAAVFRTVLTELCLPFVMKDTRPKQGWFERNRIGGVPEDEAKRLLQGNDGHVLKAYLPGIELYAVIIGKRCSVYGRAPDKEALKRSVRRWMLVEDGRFLEADATPELRVPGYTVSVYKSLFEGRLIKVLTGYARADNARYQALAIAYIEKSYRFDDR